MKVLATAANHVQDDDWENKPPDIVPNLEKLSKLVAEAETMQIADAQRKYFMIPPTAQESKGNYETCHNLAFGLL